MNTKTLSVIAQKLGFQSLETRNHDYLDFRDIAVWQVKAALEAAYQAGLEAGKKK